MILCFDIGGTGIKPAEAFSETDLRLRPRVPTPVDDYDAFLGVLRDAIAASSEPPSCIAFSLAGVLEPDTGVAKVANIRCLDGRRLQGDLQRALCLPVVIANDADAFALAEATVGAGRERDIVFGVILGTGVGGGVVVRGELINRSGGFAGEWGHGPVAQRILDEPEVILPAFPCGCGLAGCLDAVASARGIERLHRFLHGSPADSLAIVAGWQAGDPLAARTVAVWVSLLSGPLAMVCNLLGADVIAVGGGLSNSVPLILALDEEVRSKTLSRQSRPLVVPALCRIEPGLIGAAILGLRHSGQAG